MLDLDLLLKRNELCLVGRTRIHESMHEAGLYARDTRFLSRFELGFLGHRLQVLDLTAPDPDQAVVTFTNPHLRHLELGIEPQTMLVREQIRLDTALVVMLTVRNFGTTDTAGTLTLEVGADFRDMFDIRGMTPKERAEPLPAEATADGVVLAAESADQRRIRTRITGSAPATVEPLPTSGGESAAILTWQIDLARDEVTTIELRLQPEPVGEPIALAADTAQRGDFLPHVTVDSSSPEFDQFLAQCDADLAMLETSFPDGTIPAAGIPWFIAPFGRDSLIVALQTLHAYPDRIDSTLRVLAALQATEVDPWREAQPGKILHEMRYGDMARTGQIPHTPYYGSIDSTPLFVMVFAQQWLWHRDDRLYDDLIGNVRRALDWMETYGDLDGDGLLEYSGNQLDVAHISQQGWKDSGDSLHFADGTAPEGPIALVEVQGYVYAAYRWLAEVVRLRGDDDAWADALMAKAEAVRKSVEATFWMEDAGFYAQALDGAKRPVDAISSNPGHLLYCRLPSDERAARVAACLGSPELNSGWGLRTLSTEMATYNPMSYHNGSIWPHDMSLAMDGLRQYGHEDLAREFAEALLALARTAPDLRLSELYCGFPPMEGVPEPVSYPVSCSPQAWAAGAGLLALRTLLGLDPDPRHGTFSVSPHLPDGWDCLSVTGLHAFNTFTTVTAQRAGDGYRVAIDRED
jgi:glycogen debranching enzyme